ncbi:unnamed protein product [Amoebophrya sp. A120]|nr:unnamed protein product [Amoebophrya sp. A120]|eukprot:GSA120T00026032001.1
MSFSISIRFFSSIFQWDRNSEFCTQQQALIMRDVVDIIRRPSAVAWKTAPRTSSNAMR